VRVADEPVEVAAQLAHLLEHDADRKQAGQEARSFIQAHFSWEVHAASLAATLAEVVKPPVSPVPPPPEPKPMAAAFGD
jgi:glycosyltransferase involved in cell wall biosynthesis